MSAAMPTMRPRHDRELDRDPLAVLADGRHRQKIAISIPAPAGLDNLPPALPVGGPEALGDDQVERLPDRLPGAMPEDALRTGVPQADDPRSIGRHYRVGGSGDDAVGARRHRSMGTVLDLCAVGRLTRAQTRVPAAFVRREPVWS